jgi:hypothetical protein
MRSTYSQRVLQCCVLKRFVIKPVEPLELCQAIEFVCTKRDYDRPAFGPQPASYAILYNFDRLLPSPDLSSRKRAGRPFRTWIFD